MMSELNGWIIPKWALDSKPSMVKIYRISSENFIIFKNINNEVDWIASGKFNKTCTDEMRSHIDNIYSKIVLLLSYLPNDIDDKTLDDIYIICSEALAAIFNKNLTLAMEVFVSLEQRVYIYKYEKYIDIVHNTIGCNAFLLSVALLFSYIVNILCNWQVISFVMTAFCIGGIGSIASILSTKKDVNFKETLKDQSVVQDVNYKILLGGIFSCVSYAMISSNLIEPFKDFSIHQSIVIFFLCGFSERFAPSIFEKINKN
jgi:hypothetical protein